MKNIFVKFISDEDAQGSVEYVIILSLIVVASYLLIDLFKAAWVGKYNKVADHRTGIAGTVP